MRQYDIYIVNLDPTVGSEVQKTRPCLILSPDEMNDHLHTVQIAPLTTSTREYPWRVPIKFQGKNGRIALDQIRTVDKMRLVRKVGRVPSKITDEVRAVIREMLVDTP